MKITFDPSMMSGSVILEEHPLERTILLNEDTIVSVDPAGSITDLELLDVRPFGEVFDQAAGLRALRWAREQLTARGLA